MKNHFIKFSYFINIGLTGFIYAYFILFYLCGFISLVFSNIPVKIEMLMSDILELGLNMFNDEKILSLIIILISLAVIISIFVAIFYRKIVSKKTYALFSCSFIPIVIAMLLNIYCVDGFSAKNISMAFCLLTAIILGAYLGVTLYFFIKDIKLLK
ncbi:MAG: hypothetical protein RSB11_06730 [Oscillospiraceae bacterium]